jgi:ATP-dependent Clp protease ATP-binding subunit ClpA
LIEDPASKKSASYGSKSGEERMGIAMVLFVLSRRHQRLDGYREVHNLENLLILGKTGLGKTHRAIALGKRLCQQGHPTQFLPLNFLFEEIQAAKAAGRYLNYVRSADQGQGFDPR